jgi:hypothetical protein
MKSRRKHHWFVRVTPVPILIMENFSLGEDFGRLEFLDWLAPLTLFVFET